MAAPAGYSLSKCRSFEFLFSIISNIKDTFYQGLTTYLSCSKFPSFPLGFLSGESSIQHFAGIMFGGGLGPEIKAVALST